MSMHISLDLVKNMFGDNYIFSKHKNIWTDNINLSIDTRTLTKNSIFFAIQGEITDGHNYITQAFNNGAVLVVAKKNHVISSQVSQENIIWVDDPLWCFSRLAHDYLKTMPALKIALTGSNGKTTTKEMIKSAFLGVLSPEHVYASAGNKNNHFGVPLSAFEVRPHHKIAIFEMGMNHAQEITNLCNIINPNLGLITNISAAHEGNFPDGIDGVQKAKGELFLALAHQTAVVNLDDSRVKAEAQKNNFASVISFGWSQEADLRIVDRKAYNLETGYQEIILEFKQEKITCLCPLPGAHQAHNVAAALAVVHVAGFDIKKAALGIASMTLTAGRLSLSKHKTGFLIINDGYNANPASMRSGIEAVLELPAERRIAVIGAMGELGPESARFHFELGQILARSFDYLLVCKKEAQQITEGALKNGMKADNIIFKNSSEELIEPLKKLVQKDDLVFIKGSLSANMAVVAQALANF